MRSSGKTMDILFSHSSHLPSESSSEPTPSSSLLHISPLTPLVLVVVVLLLLCGPVSCWQCVIINNTHGGGGEESALHGAHTY